MSFLFNIKIISLQYDNITYLGWTISDIKQKWMKHLFSILCRVCIEYVLVPKNFDSFNWFTHFLENDSHGTPVTFTNKVYAACVPLLFASLSLYKKYQKI